MPTTVMCDAAAFGSLFGIRTGLWKRRVPAGRARPAAHPVLRIFCRRTVRAGTPIAWIVRLVRRLWQADAAGEYRHRLRRARADPVLTPGGARLAHGLRRVPRWRRADRQAR